MPQLNCLTCGIEFYRPPSLVHKRNYCSKACRMAAYPPHVALVCATCGKFYECQPSFANRGALNYCGRACANEGHKRLNTVNCLTCGKELIRRDSEMKKYVHPFCGKVCYGVWASGYFNKQSDVPCVQCGKMMRRKQHKLKDNEHQFCGRACMHEWQSQNWIGEKHHGWKGGPIPHRDYGPNWKQQAHAARKRDGYRCRACGKAQKKLQRSFDVHHIRPFREFGYIRGENDNHKAANRLTNLITLCRDCHSKTENGLVSVQPYLL